VVFAVIPREKQIPRAKTSPRNDTFGVFPQPLWTGSQTAMVFEREGAQTEESSLDRASPFILLIALFGIPAAGFVALVFLVQIPRFIYGQSAPLLLAAEIGSLIAVLVLVLALRACLALPSAPVGFYRNVLDFLAMARWHLSVKAALVGLLVLPPAWLLHVDHYLLVRMIRIAGRRALMSGDVQSGLDTVAVVYQLALTGGVPLLFALHMISRWKPANRILPWVLIPLLFVGTAIGVVLIVTLMHFSS
jgi:hypothetical protein